MTGCLQLLTALALTGPVPVAPVPPESPATLSPASLPAPPTPAAPATRQVSWALEFDHIAGTPDECRLKVVAAVAALDRFRFAEIGPDGVVGGYTDTCRVKVLVAVTPPYDGAVVYVLVAGREPGTERVSIAVRNHLKNTPLDPKTPERAGTRAPDLEKTLPQIAAHFDARTINRLSRHFGAVAELVLDKRGYTIHPTPSAPAISGAWGVREGHFSAAVTTPGVPGVSTNVLVVSIGEDAEAAGREAKAVAAAILKILFE